jgi:hypothetical protein
MQMRLLATFTLFFALVAPVSAAEKKATKPVGQRFEISFPKEISASALDGHILLLISNNNDKEPRFQVNFIVQHSQQVFGTDVDALAPGTPVVIDSSTLGYPAESLNDVPAGDYWIQAVLNIYETFHLGNGHTVKLPPDKGEGQHWPVKPGNLYSKPVKMHLDPKAPQTARISLTEKVPAVDDEAKVVDSLLGWDSSNDQHEIVDNKWVKHIRIQSDLLTKFWGRPTYIGAVILVPDGWEEHSDAHYPVIVLQDHFIAGCREYFRSAPSHRKIRGMKRARWAISSIKTGPPGACPESL